MSKKVNKSQTKRNQEAKASKANANKSQKKTSQKHVHNVPFTVRLTLLPNSGTVLATSNFRNLALLRGMLEEAVDNATQNNNASFERVSIRHAKWVQHMKDIHQKRNAAAWSKHEKSRLNKAERHNSSTKK